MIFNHFHKKYFATIALVFICVPRTFANPLVKKTMKAAQIKRSTSDYAAMHKIYDQALKADPKNIILMTAKADVFNIEKKYQEALKIAIQAHQASPNYDWPLVVMKSAYIGLKNYTLAAQTIELLQKLVQPEKYLSFMGGLEHSQKKYAQAEKYFSKARTLKYSAGLFEISAWNFKLWGKPKQNDALLKHILSQDPKNLRAIKALAQSQKDRGMVGTSLKTVEEGLALCGNTPCTELRSKGLQKHLFSGINSGLYLGAGPIGFRGESKVFANFLSTENIFRILGASEKNLNNVNELIRPSNNYQASQKVEFLAYHDNNLLQKYELQYQQSLQSNQRFYMNKTINLNISLQKYIYSALFGDMIFEPKLHGSYVSANAGSATNLDFNTPYSYYLGGLSFTAKSSANFKISTHQLKLGVKYGQTIESKSKFAIANINYNYKNTFGYFLDNTKMDYFLNASALTSKRFTSIYTEARYSLGFTLKAIHHKRHSAFLKNQTIFHRDFINDRISVHSDLNLTTFGYDYTKESLSFHSKITFTSGITADAYNNILWDFHLKYKWRVERPKRLGRFNYKNSVPVFISLGTKNAHMTDLVKELRENMASFYAGIKYFF